MSQFENPLVETEFSLQRQYHKYFKENKELIFIDLTEKIPIYRHNINPKVNIESYQAINFLVYHLTNITNAYKQYPSEIINTMLFVEAKKVKELAKGSKLTDKSLIYYIDNAIINKDTITVKSNSTIRFLSNPFYITKIGECVEKEKNKQINKILGNKKKSNNMTVIENSIRDHDCFQGQITKKSLAKDSGLALRTINNYLKEFDSLNDLFNEVKKYSKTEKQINTRIYNLNKLVKRAS